MRIASPVVVTVAAASLLIVASCSDKGAGPTPQDQYIEKPVPSEFLTVAANGYEVTAPGAMSLLTPGFVKCSGGLAVRVPAGTQSTTYGVGGGFLKLQMTSGALQATLAQVPTIDSATLASLSSSANLAAAAGINIFAVFRASGATDSIKGQWLFDSVDVGLLRVVAGADTTGTLKAMIANIDSMAATIDGNLMLNVRPAQIESAVRRDWYGHVMVQNLADTATMRATIASAGAGAWSVIGDVSQDTVQVQIGTGGDITYTASNAAWQPQPYVYKLHPAAGDCPNSKAPAWYGLFAAANPR